MNINMKDNSSRTLDNHQSLDVITGKFPSKEALKAFYNDSSPPHPPNSPTMSAGEVADEPLDFTMSSPITNNKVDDYEQVSD